MVFWVVSGMKKNEWIFALVYIIFTLSVVANVALIYNIYADKYEAVCYLDDSSAEEYYTRLSNGMSDSDNEFELVYRYALADPGYSGTGKSYLLGITKNKEMYAVFGHQQSYCKPLGQETASLLPYFAVTKKLSDKEYNEIIALADDAVNEYIDKNVEDFMEKYPADWHSEVIIRYNNRLWSVYPKMLAENSFYEESYSQLDENFQMLDLPSTKELWEYVCDLLGEYY